MSAVEMVRQWQATVKSQLLGCLHAHQAKALGLISWTMALAGSCCAGTIASLAPAGMTKPSSVRRRVERLLANRRLDATAAMLQLTRVLLRDWGGRKLLLILDETPKHNQLRCMRLSVAYHKRTVPLLSICYPPHRPPQPMPRLVRWMLREVAACLPQQASVTLLADRGLCWPTLIRQCRRLGWHYLLRLQCDTRVRLPNPSGKPLSKPIEKPVGQLLRRRGEHFFGQDVRIFKKARWLAANVVGVWEHKAKEPWLLVSDAPASYTCCRSYCKRSWCEQSHRDDKSHGLNWQASQVNDPQHAQRLMLLMALASLLCIATGVAAIKRGVRRLFEPRCRRLCSIFRLGRQCLAYAVTHDRPLVNLCALPPP